MADQNVRLLITGQSGTGKSTLLRYQLRQVLQGGMRRHILLLDHKDDHWQTLRAQGFTRVEYGANDALYKVDWTKLLKERKRIYIHVEGITHEERLDLADKLGWAFLSLPSSLLIMEEAAAFYPAVGKRPEGIERLLNGGRGIGADIWLVTQRAQQVHPEGLAACNFCQVFRLPEENSAKKAASLISVDVDKVRSLPSYTYFDANLETGGIQQKKTVL